MPRKGMRSLLFSSKDSSQSSSTSSPIPDEYASPSRFGFSPLRPSFYESVMDRTLDMVEPTIVKWNTESSEFGRVTSLFYESRKEAKDFVKCVNNLQRAMQFLVMENSSSDKMIRAQNLMEIAMKRLEKEFYQILSTSRVYLDPESVSRRSSITSLASKVTDSDDEDYDNEGDYDDDEAANAEEEDVPSLVLSDLTSIAECMISSGYAKECLKIYKIMRKSIVDEGIYRLGVEKFSSSQIRKMHWESLETRINDWLSAMRPAMKTLFNGERILCDQVFASSSSIRDSCFSEITREGAMILFGFPENVAKNTKTSPEKVLRLLDMYNAISDHWPEFESIFSLELTSEIKSQAMTSLMKLGEFVKVSFDDLESSVSKSSSKSPVTGAGIHHLTTEVMNYIAVLSDHTNILIDIFSDTSPSPKNPELESFFGFCDSDESYPAPAISHKLAWLILILLCKLDAAAKRYKDISQSYLFLANNLQYIVGKVRTSNLKHLLGDEWLAKHEAKVKQFAFSYERLGWNHVIESIPSNPMAVDTTEKVKEIFRKFNASFERVCREQSLWIVFDISLRENIKSSIERKIIRLYRAFYEAHHPSLNRREVRFAPEDVRNRLSALFSAVLE